MPAALFQAVQQGANMAPDACRTVEVVRARFGELLEPGALLHFKRQQGVGVAGLQGADLRRLHGLASAAAEGHGQHAQTRCQQGGAGRFGHTADDQVVNHRLAAAAGRHAHLVDAVPAELHQRGAPSSWRPRPC